MKHWTFTSAWNQSLEEREDRPMKTRDNVWASELGKSPLDVWLKMRATPQTNPPNARSLRKFEAGNVFEWIVSLILSRAGILQTSQKWTSHQYPGLLQVTGKADFIAGGKPDYDRWLETRRNLEQTGLPEVFLRGGEAVIKHFIDKYPEGLMNMPLEIKSVSAFMFDALERKGVGSKIHRLQLFHYLKGEKYPAGNLVYICRDDLRMAEYKVTAGEAEEKEYKDSIELISKYHIANEQPPLEKNIVWDDDIGKFAKNFNVAYSGYLTKLYGFKDQLEFDEIHVPIVSRWNRVMNRVKTGQKMTAKNEDVLKEISNAGYSVDALLEKFAGETAGDEVL